MNGKIENVSQAAILRPELLYKLNISPSTYPNYPEYIRHPERPSKPRPCATEEQISLARGLDILKNVAYNSCMSKVFISYSTQDESTARPIYAALSQVGAEPFLSSISIKPGANWADEISKNLTMAKLVIFIATKSSCVSPDVQQELGMALSQNKQIIPMLIDITPEELPGLVSKHQAIDAKNDVDLRKTIDDIGQRVEKDKFWFGVILGVALLVLGG